jgi:hypothetical protein
MLFTSSRKLMLEHLGRLKAVVRLQSANDRKNAARLETDLDKVVKRHALLSRIRIAIFVLLYASVVSTLVSGLPLLSDVLQSITAIGGLLGVGVLGLVALWLTWRLNRLWDHMVLLYAHLIAIYEKNNKGAYTADDFPVEEE